MDPEFPNLDRMSGQFMEVKLRSGEAISIGIALKQPFKTAKQEGATRCL